MFDWWAENLSSYVPVPYWLRNLKDLLCQLMIYRRSHKTMSVKTTNDRRSQEARTGHYSRARASNMNSIQLNDLPWDILYRIASKLPPKEFVRTSILSSEWGSIWSAMYPRLTFDVASVCKCNWKYLHRHTQKFINYVDAALKKHQGEVIQALDIRIDFVDSRQLADHINRLVEFAVSSQTKRLTLDLKPERFWEYNECYVFPFILLDQGGTMSHLRHMQLSFVSLDPPSYFRGFPNLRRLYLTIVCVNVKDLEHVLSCCRNLEWLRIDRCQDLKGELIVDVPLTHLSYLRVEYCTFITGIKFCAANLSTFVYEGHFIPIDLTHSLKLQSANIMISGKAIFQHALASLLDSFPRVQYLALRISFPCLQEQLLWGNPLKLYNLKRLQLAMLIFPKDFDKILHSFSFLRAMPFIEELVVHFSGVDDLWLAEVGPCRKDLEPPCTYKYLKNICITGFCAARGQLEFLLHLVENAPALEVLNIKIGNRSPEKELWLFEGTPPFKKAKRIVRNCLLPLNLKCNVNILCDHAWVTIEEGALCYKSLAGGLYCSRRLY